MGRFARDSGGSFENPPLGNHLAICYRLVDLGTQHDEYNGKQIVRNQLLVSWELPNELMKDGKPFVVAKFYTNSLHEKAALRHDLSAWRTRDFTPEELNKFDLQSILGKPCMLSIIEKDGKVKVGSIAAIPKGTLIPPVFNTPHAFWIEEWNQKIFDSLSEGIKEIIIESDEYKEMQTGGLSSMKDDLPWKEKTVEELMF